MSEVPTVTALGRLRKGKVKKNMRHLDTLLDSPVVVHQRKQLMVVYFSHCTLAAISR